MKIVFASKNTGKIYELQNLLQGQQIKIIPQAELNVSEIPETGLSFVENALLKARHAARYTGLPAIADDSGLEVNALNGAPGIYSARYAGTDADSDANIEKILAALKNVPDEKRQAAFQCVLVFIKNADDPTPLICQGTWRGMILKNPRGKNGFGYDPIFFVPTHHCSAADLSVEIKNQISHRGIALKKLLLELPEKLS